MRREGFEHTIRPAGAVLDVSEVIVIGSQALVKGGLVDPRVLKRRLRDAPELEPEIRDSVARRIADAGSS